MVFAVQKYGFWHAKRGFLQRKKGVFTTQKGGFYNAKRGFLKEHIGILGV